MSTMFAQPPAPLSGLSSPTPIQQTSPPPYTSQAQYTPPSSSEAHSHTSPTHASPRATMNFPSHLQMPARQIRQPKGPVYTPAVLRKTEKPPRSSPPKSRVHYGSPDSGIDVGSGELPAGIVPGVSRIVTEEWNEEVLGPVTGAPSRNHWKPDTASPDCDDNTCDRSFTWLNRRHHCRRCGRIFCGDHSAHYVPLDQHARFHPQGSRQRSCNACSADYRAWETTRVSRTNSTNSRDGTMPGTPSIAMPGRPSFGDNAKASVAASVPNNWNWSTF